MDKDVVHLYNTSLRHKKERNNAICSTLDGPRECHTEGSKSESKIKTAYMWNLEKRYK